MYLEAKQQLLHCQAFDNPRWMFLSTDLDFFIRYELADQQRRAQADPASTRIVPTIQDYRDHLASKGLVASLLTPGPFCHPSVMSSPVPPVQKYS